MWRVACGGTHSVAIKLDPPMHYVLMILPTRVDFICYCSNFVAYNIKLSSQTRSNNSSKWNCKVYICCHLGNFSLPVVCKDSRKIVLQTASQFFSTKCCVYGIFIQYHRVYIIECRGRVPSYSVPTRARR